MLTPDLASSSILPGSWVDFKLPRTHETFGLAWLSVTIVTGQISMRNV